MTVRFILDTAPTTKKTSNRIVTLKRRIFNTQTRNMDTRPFHKILPSEQYEEWFALAMQCAPIIAAALRKGGVNLPILGDIAIKATFYRRFNTTGDLLGYEQALADWLQSPTYSKKGKQLRDGAGIIGDDRQVISWDGSRLKVDRDRPRIEVEIRAGESLFDATCENRG